MYKKQNWILFAALALALLLLRLPSFEMPLDPDSSANAFFASHMLRGETLYDKFHPGHHLPGIYYTFELAFLLFGDNPVAPKLLLFPWALACAWLMYLMGRSFFDNRTGILSAFFFVLISSQRWVTGMTVEMEHFANLSLIAGVFITILLLRKRAPAWQFIWVGMLGAVSILYKVVFCCAIDCGRRLYPSDGVDDAQPGRSMAEDALPVALDGHRINDPFSARGGIFCQRRVMGAIHTYI